MDKPELGTEGSALWDDVIEFTDDHRPDELRILATACQTLDSMTELRRVFDEQGRQWTVQGSTKQPVSNPLMTEWRFLSETFSRLMKQLQIPNTEERELALEQDR